MSIEMEKDDYILGVWCLSGAKRNWLCFALKRADKWILQYRFRYFEDDKAFDSQDRKSFFRAEGPGTDPEEKILKSVDTIVGEMIRLGFGKELERALIRSTDPEDLMLALSGMKSMNIKKMTPEEAKKAGYVFGSREGEIKPTPPEAG